ncbi:response regulator [Pseudomaricurvus alkylphenolicus]|uniref:response regulator n=1 Tax=Pseudomaricurvus alkylphenolicus TaxID=1306991 RepID=UPI001422923A|nr:response regulator [Pseudomaricurvus alkylphenolicus]NIB43696.1 response regulator [Pseudomaricurvus alkylphenolicus]
MSKSLNSILIVEDDIELATLIKDYLASRHFEVFVEHSGTTAVERILELQPGMVILDLMLPGKDGISICREVRPNYEGVILMLTASNDSVDQILGLEIGADDFVQKPVEPRILLARVRALLRRYEASPTVTASTETNHSATAMQFSGLLINPSSRSVTLDQRELEFTAPEFDMLAYLATNAGQIISRDQLFRQLRNIDYDGQNRFVDITMSHIRKKLGDSAGKYLKTVRGKGYLFVLSSEN